MNKGTNDTTGPTPPKVEESVLILHPTRRSGVLWDPSVGAESLQLLSRLPLSEKERTTVTQEAVEILSRCIPPTAVDGHITGIVIGHIQSGKTTSFSVLTALARDNGFQLVIVIAGTSVPLFGQSEERLKDALGLHERYDRKWLELPNPEESHQQRIRSALDDWNDRALPEGERQTVLMVVMKNHARLRKLNRLLGQLELHHVPTLVIDDEADQAGLNTAVTQGEMSATYRRLVELRSLLPHHSYVQYTATPQAPLLINLIDILSPNYAELLTPGEGYVGGHTFFFEKVDSLVRIIPEAEIPAADTPVIDPPPSLLTALRIFYLGVSAGLLEPAETRKNRSMMIHPSQLTAKHADYKRWVDRTHGLWAETLRNREDPDRPELLKGFREAYDELAATVHSIPAFEGLVEVLPRAVSQTSVIEVNAVRGKTPQIDWRGTYAHILVGGQAMDRGFTVEGLTVSYMPRGVGVGNADTLQQRARFMGYKGPYLGYCRVYLDQEAYDAYRNYVSHETDIHRQLQVHGEGGKPLSEWKRAFLLDKALRPTRDQVLDIPWIRGDFSDEWYAPKAPHDSVDAVEHNRDTVKKFLSTLTLRPDDGSDRRTETMRHGFTDMPLARVLERLLVPMRVPRPSDSARYYGLLLQVQRHLEKHPDEVCKVYLMSNGKIRKRSVDDLGEIPNLFQGADPADGSTYPGDRMIHAPDGLTVQVHVLQVLGEDQSMVADDVPAITIWVPRRVSASWISQPQGGAKDSSGT